MDIRNIVQPIRSPSQDRAERIKAGLNEQDSQTLIALWIRRKDGLGEVEWQRLFILVRYVLQRCSAPILASLPESREHYIHDFFLRKVMETAAQATPLDHVGVLVGYFQNFLKDQTRAAWLQRSSSFDAMEEHERDHLEAESSSCPDCESQDIDSLLGEAGLTRGAVDASAAEFIATLTPIEQTYLRYNTCADEPESMSSIAKRMEIANYHEKARKLGITGLKSGFVTGYEKTRIGGWLQSLGIEVSLDWWPQLKSAMALLCLVVLSSGEEP